MLCKIIVFLLCVYSIVAEVAIPPELQEYINYLHDDCLKRIGLTEADHQSYNIENKDPKMMCYMECLMKTAKWMDMKGNIQYDFIVDTAHPQVAHILAPAVNKCRTLPDGPMECEKSYQFNLCLKHADPEHWFLV